MQQSSHGSFTDSQFTLDMVFLSSVELTERFLSRIFGCGVCRAKIMLIEELFCFQKISGNKM